MNFIQVAGHLGADPEVRYTSTGKKVTVLRLAAKARKSSTDVTIWWRITIWGEQYDYMIPYLKKGSPVIAAGNFEAPEIYNDREGNPQPSMNITASYLQFSPFGKAERDAGSKPKTEQQAQPAYTAPQDNGSFEDEVPF